MELLKIVNKNKTYQGKDGKTYYSKQFYLVIDTSPTNKVYIAIDPTFTKDRRDYDRLDMFAKLVVREKKDDANTQAATSQDTPF